MMAYSGGDEFPCVVGEVGSYSTKMGFAGEDYPRSYFRSTTAVKRNKDPKAKHPYLKQSHDFFSAPLNRQDQNDEGWETANPIETSTGLIYDGGPSSSTIQSHGSEDVTADSSPASPEAQAGSVRDAECYAQFSSHLTHGYESALCTSPAQTPLLLIERSYNPPPIRQKLLEIIFEEQGNPATFFARDAVCACYAVGRTTATVIDVGYNGTVVTPVYDGYVETKGILRSPVGSKMIDDAVLRELDGLYKTKMSKRGSWKTGTNGKVDYIMPLYQCRTKGFHKRVEPFHQLARLDLARMGREGGSAAGVAAFGYAAKYDVGKDTPLSEMYHQYANAPKTKYKLPDGTEIDIPQTKRFDPAELLFGKEGKSAQAREERVGKMRDQLSALTSIASDGVDDENRHVSIDETLSRRRRGTPRSKSTLSHQALVKACIPHLTASIGELTQATIPAMMCDSAFRCDRDQQAQLLGNAVLCGGGACLSTSVASSSTADYGNAMAERVREEVEAIVHASTPGWRVKVLSPGISERAICSWLGGSILGSLGSFHEMWITKAEYEEHGPAIINRKCP
jgi:actin-related protein